MTKYPLILIDANGFYANQFGIDILEGIPASIIDFTVNIAVKVR